MSLRIARWLVDDRTVNTMVVANSAVIFALLFDGLPTYVYTSLIAADCVFNLVFFVEITMKYLLFGKRLRGNPSGVFDVVLATAIVVSVFCGKYSNVTYLYALRSIRLLKCLRLFKVVPNYERLVKNIRMAARTCCGILLGMFVLMFIVSILLTMMFSAESSEYFSDPLTSLYSVFRLMTVEGWYDIPNEIAEGHRTMARFGIKLLFSAVVLIVGIFGVSFITSVVTDELAADNNDEVMRKLDKIENEIKDLRKG